ncbi:uncharacterized protein LOC133121251 [Conger conger]|uniref:uncharacterized protein LOC133121251 n=1 Tax=Conger conger TaxID=82655 RepID=UPI002A5A1E2D|nr:uncharacterized protein LOC133121251 [Conger conger]
MESFCTLFVLLLLCLTELVITQHALTTESLDVGIGDVVQVTGEVGANTTETKKGEAEPFYLVTTEEGTEDLEQSWENELLQALEKTEYDKLGAECITIEMCNDGKIKRTRVITKGDTTTTVTEVMENGITTITTRVSRGGKSTSSVITKNSEKKIIPQIGTEAEIVKIEDITEELQKDGSVIETKRILKDGKAKVSKETKSKLPMYGKIMTRVKKMTAKKTDGTIITTVIKTEVSKDGTVVTNQDSKVVETVLTMESSREDGTRVVEQFTTKDGKTTFSKKILRGTPIQDNVTIKKDTKKTTILQKDGSMLITIVIHEGRTITIITKTVKGDITNTRTEIKKNDKTVQTSQETTKKSTVVNKDGSSTTTTETSDGKKVIKLVEVTKGSVSKSTKKVFVDDKPLKEEEESTEKSSVTDKDITTTTTVIKKGEHTITVTEVTKGSITASTTIIKRGTNVLKTLYFTTEEEMEVLDEPSQILRGAEGKETIDISQQVNGDGTVTVTTTKTTTTREGKITVTQETESGVATKDTISSTTKKSKEIMNDGSTREITETTRGETVQTVQKVTKSGETKTTIFVQEGKKPEETTEEIVEKKPSVNKDGSITITTEGKKGDTITTTTKNIKGSTTIRTTEVNIGNKVLEKTIDVTETSAVLDEDGTAKTTTVTKQGDRETTVTKVIKGGVEYETTEVSKGGKPVEKESTEQSTVVGTDGTTTTTTVIKKGDISKTVTDVMKGETMTTTTAVSEGGEITTTVKNKTLHTEETQKAFYPGIEGKVIETVITIETGQKDGSIKVEEVTTKDDKTILSQKIIRGESSKGTSALVHRETKKSTVLQQDGSMLITILIRERETVTIIRKVTEGHITTTTTEIWMNNKIVQTTKETTKKTIVVNEDGSTTTTTETNDGKTVTTWVEITKGGVSKIKKTVTEEGK